MQRRKFIKTVILTSGFAMSCQGNLSSSEVPGATYKLTMLYNNIAGDNSLKTGWGLSLWIEYGDKVVLFDTGGEPEILMENISSTGLDIKKIISIIISHNHWDHVNGLPAVLDLCEQGIPVYVPQQSADSIQQANPGSNIKGVDQAQEIEPHIWTTGQLMASADLYEQSVVITKDGGAFVFTGCSHPGIVQIVEKAKAIRPEDRIQLVAGGFHLRSHSDQQVRVISSRLKELGVQVLAPSHCTGERAMQIFEEEWGDSYLAFYLGDIYQI
jgi:7,8-dihydropterin-6-yl-methyl-4-(beta-D-ribofuranosyl)aminobenzene 5'-phosphate synthase